MWDFISPQTLIMSNARSSAPRGSSSAEAKSKPLSGFWTRARLRLSRFTAAIYPPPAIMLIWFGALLLLGLLRL
jgi:cytochrome c biogenesis factor